MIPAILILLSLIALLWLGLLISPVHRVTFRDLLNADLAATGSEGAPHVTLIAPARNEAGVLPITVPTYCRQAYPTLEVVIVDDQSDDATPAILQKLAGEFPNLKTLRTQPRPEGWLGKTWAVDSGVKWAVQSRPANMEPPDSDEIFIFTDSDCAFHPNTIATVVGEMRRRDVEMLSVLPRMEFGPPCEKIALPALITVLSMVFPLGLVNNAKSALALAAGGFIAMRRSAYEKIGGHESVRSFIVEDVNLARRAKSMGVRLYTALTRDLVTTHMYESWQDLWEGLSKNAYAGMDYQPRKFWTGLIVGTGVAVLPPVYLVATGWWTAISGSPSAIAAVALSAVIVIAMTLIHARTIRHMGLPIYHALLMPVSIAIYLAISVSSAYQYHYRGGNVWKGRRYTSGLRPE